MSTLERHRRRAADEHGAVVALVALTMPVLLLIAALVIDIGNWKEKDRFLQNRADAGALAAGVEYIGRLKACIGTDPVAKAAAVTAIKDAARGFAGATGTAGPQNQGINEQTRVWVGVNAATYNGADDTDNPTTITVCDEHDPDAISPDGGLWTDVKLTESNIPSFFGSLGFPLSEVNSRARVEMKQIIGIRERGLPFVAETGDQIECVWAQFVNAVTGVPNDGFTVSPSNPVALANGPYTWTASNVSLTLTDSSAEDIAVRYWVGSIDGTPSVSNPCVFSTINKGPVPRELGSSLNAVAIDWVNVYDNSANPGANQAPKLRNFVLTGNTCGGPGYLYTSDPNPALQCRVDFAATVDTGSNNVQGSVIVEVANDPDDRASTAKPNPVNVTFPVGTGARVVTGTVIINPNTVTNPTTVSQDYTQVGQMMFRVRWEQTTGQVGGTNCAGPSGPCTGTFLANTVQDQYGNNVANVQHQTYMHDPLAAVPLVAAELGFSNSIRGQINQVSPSFNITLTHTAVDQDHIVIFRDSVQSSGNRTRAIWCGNPPGQGAAALEDAIVNGCAKGLMENIRNDSCVPEASPTGQAGDPWDCVQIEQGNKTSIAKGLEDRFQCTTNAWTAARAAGTYPPEADQRWAYIILTEYGRTFNANNNDWLPIAGLLRVYVTGWDQQGGGGGPVNCAENDDPPRGYDGNGSQLWGHVVEPIVIDPDVITGDGTCDTNLQNIQCKPILVR
jgi:Flp pilus assembly protein TadG